jgi:hypothetical protein
MAYAYCGIDDLGRDINYTGAAATSAGHTCSSPSTPIRAYRTSAGHASTRANGSTTSLASIHLGYSGPPVAGQQSYGQDTDLTEEVGAIDGALAQLGAAGGIEVHTVPEPGSLALVGIGLACVFAVGRRLRGDGL